VSSLGVNYLFYGLRQQAPRPDDPGAAEPFVHLFRTFLETYLRESGDREILEALPPFFAFRALVIAHPRWYPTLAPATRAALIRFARRMMASSAYDPGDLREPLEAGR
ncbi:MAG: aminoglycoside phosphotransferase family protein, partial [Candidatus Rokubacteria bacterium]|nr:aminoglycoside phosphotransferase family protein [Candidatus Rokubacteria bacterium]